MQKGNPKSTSQVNQKSGPRTGNHGTPGKRSEFTSAKESRAPLADSITRAYAARAQDDRVNPKLEPISSNSKRSFKK